jgi:hypothetical protein
MQDILFIITTLLHYLKLCLQFIWNSLSFDAHFEHPSWRTTSQKPSLPTTAPQQHTTSEIDNPATMDPSQNQQLSKDELIKAAMMVSAFDSATHH